MLESIIKYNQLIKSAIKYLQDAGLRPKTIAAHEQNWNNVKAFLIDKGYKSFSKRSLNEYILEKFGSNDKNEMEEKNKKKLPLILRLMEFKESGIIITAKNRKSKYPLKQSGFLKIFIDNFIISLQNKSYSRSSIEQYQIHLQKLSLYLNNQKIESLEECNLPVIIQYIEQFDPKFETNIVVMLRCLKGFFKHLYENEHIPQNIERNLPKAKRSSQPKIPSVYNSEEIKILLGSLNKFSKTSKRNFAIILIAQRLGLRASDISRLEFKNFDWEKNEINIIQLKNGKKLKLPLFSEIGNAIIDYVKHERPNSKSSYIFLIARPPYTHFSTSNVVTHIVQRAFLKSGLNLKNKRFGPHALRHSLAYRLLKQETSINTITEVFGHKNSNSIKYYTRIDIESLSKCKLEVPEINKQFYTQKGGVLIA